MKDQIPFEKFMSENPDYLVISHSQIEAWDQCQRKWHYTSMQKLATEVTWPMKFSGLMLHPAFSYWYLSNGKQIMSSDEWQKCWTKYHDAVGSVPCPRGKQSIYSIQHASDIVSEYIAMFDKDFTMYNVIASEKKYYRILPNIKAVYLSIPDLVLERVGDNKTVVNDFKHSTWDINSDLDVFDRQLLGQAFVCDAQFLMKTHIRSMAGSVRDDSPASCAINRQFDPVETDQLKEWIDETCQAADEILRAKSKSVYVKQAPKGCFAFNKKCEFKDLCSLGAARAYAIESWPKRERD
jgi:hypothetical protein